jgi:hypothetical protein
MIEFLCKECGHKYQVADKYAGKKARCKKCMYTTIIPQPQPAFDLSLDDCEDESEYNEVFREMLMWEKVAPPAEVVE